MLLPRILAPVRASIATSKTFISPSTRVLDAIRSANGSSTPSAAVAPSSLSFVRHSAHQAQGRANGAKDGPGKRLGAKKSGGTPPAFHIHFANHNNLADDWGGEQVNM